MMNKKNIIIILSIVIAVILAVVVFIVINNLKSDETILIEEFDQDLKITKTIKIDKTKQVNKLKDLISKIKVSFDEDSQQIAVKKDIRVTLNSGEFYYIQKDYKDSCYYENPNDGTKAIVKLPDNFVDTIISMAK